MSYQKTGSLPSGWLRTAGSLRACNPVLIPGLAILRWLSRLAGEADAVRAVHEAVQAVAGAAEGMAARAARPAAGRVGTLRVAITVVQASAAVHVISPS
jgi:hypothetical protein